MKPSTDHPQLSRSGHYWHLSGGNGRTAWECIDYLIDCVDRQRLRSPSVELRAYALKMWVEYINSKSLSLLEVTDFTFVEFAEHSVSKKSKRTFGDPQARRRSANQVLRCIYLFYSWLQRSEYGESIALLGPSQCQVTSTLNCPGKHRSRFNYPATYRFAGENSKHNRNYVPSENDRRLIVAHFYAKYPDGLAQRNALVLDLALNVGWRRSSILSLTVDQFLGAPERDCTLISPPEQKFGYTLAFSVDSTLVSRVLGYIGGHRAEVVRRTGTSSQNVFLNENLGRPLSAGAITRVFAEARMALGLPVGVGLHSWRRAFAIATMAREIERRRRLGVDRPFSDIAAVVADRLGHESLRSQDAYIRGHGVAVILGSDPDDGSD